VQFLYYVYDTLLYNNLYYTYNNLYYVYDTFTINEAINELPVVKVKVIQLMTIQEFYSIIQIKIKELTSSVF
jgi:hypothetical protein